MHFTSFLSREALWALASLPLGLVACSGSVDSSSQSASTEGLSTKAPTSPVSTAICKGALPDVCEICADGKSECAHWVIEEGKCEVQICPPVSVTPPPLACTGPLPKICEVCANGKDACAHWTVVDGKCEVEICGTPSTTPPKPPVCSGPLPDVCEICPDGKSECAHWAVVDGKCEVEICGDPSTTPAPVTSPPPASG
jgi:hypothetical protein